MDVCYIGFIATILTIFDLHDCKFVTSSDNFANIFELDSDFSEISCGFDPKLQTNIKVIWDHRRSQKDKWMPYGIGANKTVAVGWYYRCKLENQSVYYNTFIFRKGSCNGTGEAIMTSVIIYVVVGVVIGLLIILAIVGFFIWKRSKRNATQKVPALIRNNRMGPNGGHDGGISTDSQRSVDDDGYILPLRDPSQLYDDAMSNSEYMEVLPNNTLPRQGNGPLYENISNLRKK